jgi:hypothetical protein
MRKLIGGFVVFAEKEPSIRDALRGIDGVEKPLVALTPEARMIVEKIYDIQKSGKKPALRSIKIKILRDARDEVMKQPLVEPENKVTVVKSDIVHVEETVESDSLAIRPVLLESELKIQLSDLIKAGYLNVEFQGKRNIQEVYKLTPEGVKEIEKFRKVPGVV